MSEQAEARDVGGGMDVHIGHGVGGVAVQPEHPLDGRRGGGRGRNLMLDRGRDDAGAQRLGQHQAVARPASPIAPHPLGMDRTGHGKAVFWLPVVDAVAAQNIDARFADLVEATAQNVGQHRRSQLFDGEGHQVDRHQGLRAHRIDVAQGIRRRDGAEGVGVIDDGREEVGGDHQGEVGSKLVDRSVIAGLQPDQDVGVVEPCGQVAQDLSQVFRTDLAGSTRTVRPLREPHFFHGTHDLHSTKAVRVAGFPA